MEKENVFDIVHSHTFSELMEFTKEEWPEIYDDNNDQEIDKDLKRFIKMILLIVVAGFWLWSRKGPKNTVFRMVNSVYQLTKILPFKEEDLEEDNLKEDD